MPKSLQKPEQELRFTRAAQALPYWLASAVLTAAGVTLLATSLYRDVNPSLPHPAWALLPLVLAALCLRLALRLTRHAYLILTPLGVEVFPFFRPQQGMQIIYWQEIVEIESDEVATRLTLHFNVEQTSGVHLSLHPIPSRRRHFLLHALRQRMSHREGRADKK